MKSSLPMYKTIQVEGRIVYVKESALNHLSEVQAMIFDCDGVLIDTRRSYNTTIVRTARFILGQLLGFPFPQRIITQSTIQTLRGSGGFNNDWDSTHVILLYLFCCLPKPFLDRFRQAHRERIENTNKGAQDGPTQLGQLSHHLRGKITKQQLQATGSRIQEKLARFVEKADSSGVPSLENKLFADRHPAWRIEALRAFKNFLGYPENGANSLLATIFDEIFYGPTLFETAHQCRPRYYIGAGAIENEKPIITESTLNQLADLIGKRNLGIASGRGTLATKKTLGRLLNDFNPKARVFLEDEEVEPHDDHETPRVERAKPAPYSLLKSAQAMKKFKRAFYVGDSAEDLIMAERANKVDPRYLFVGVTEYGYDPQSRRRTFMERAVDVIIPTVNQLPGLLRKAKT